MENWVSKKISVCFDLGNDSFKACFCFKKNEKTYYGKILEKSIIPMSTICSETYYDEKKSKWVFGGQVNQVKSDNLYRIVKIKYLLSLLDDSKFNALPKKTKKDIAISNQSYYQDRNCFPAFVYPADETIFDNEFNLEERETKGYTYKVDGYTPRDVCELFFAFIKDVVDEAIKEVIDDYGLDYSYRGYNISFVYPSGVSEAYICELRRLLGKTFGAESICQSLSTTRALSYYAHYLRKVKNDEPFLLFDIGDEYVSVTKAYINEQNQIVCDPTNDHNAPEHIGGNDIDKALFSKVNSRIVQKETIGSPSFGELGHLDEKEVNVKGYLVLKSLKNAKVILSSDALSSSNEDKVPISITREVSVQCFIDKSDISSTVKDNNIYHRIFDYIKRELDRPLNYDVNKVFLGGGTSETLGFKSFIAEQLRMYCKSTNHIAIEFDNFDTATGATNKYSFADYEDIIYSPCLGANLAAINNDEINVGIAYTYGTYLVKTGTSDVYFEPLINKGTFLKEGKNVFSSGKIQASNGTPEHFYQIFLSNEQVKRKTRIDKLSYIGDEESKIRLVIGEALNSTKIRYDDNAFQYAGLSEICVLKGKKPSFVFYVNHYGTKCRIKTVIQVSIIEGFIINDDGTGYLFIENYYKNNRPTSQLRSYYVELDDYYGTRIYVREDEVIPDIENINFNISVDKSR